MPTISVFYGIVIKMYWSEHAPPHFHAFYADQEALIDIRELAVMRGSLPRRAVSLVLDWAELRQAELFDDWAMCERLQNPNKIKPLE